MTPIETLTLAAYFFVLVILAVYGWHRYYLVYLYMKHKDQQPTPLGSFEMLPRVTVQLPIYNEMYVAEPSNRRGLPDRLPAGNCSRSRCWTIRSTKRRR